ncbi:MAG: glutamine-hydrolyzing carbamoyl-phosphate synthase small subunit [Coriobacteriia bacterium]|nr:glutamine-hydrolyzing carbamoyl-phosphate synthase small subunit [Coriobacteriia bacterium]
MTQGPEALLALEDGTVFRGIACGASGEAAGELCFNTSMSGYQEVLTDPSYAGQIVTMTMPHIGNYGVNGADMESRGVFAKGFVVREMCDEPSSWRSEQSLPAFLAEKGIVAIQGIDTRRLTRHLREAGAMRAVISTTDLSADSLVAKAAASQGLVGRDLVAEVACTAPYRWGTESPCDSDLPVDTGVLPVKPSYRVVAMDSGIKYNILRRLSEAGCELTVVPPTTSAEEILALQPDGLFFANGPGDPSAVDYLYGTLRELLRVKPVFGICLGHQMLSLAVGATTFKLKYGHRGGNQPVMNLLNGRVEITSQNHGFCVDFGSIGGLVAGDSGGLTLDAGDIGSWVAAGVAPVVRSQHFGRVQLSHVNLNDMTVEGIRLLDTPAFSVQYHPEAAPGPHDARYLFGAFTRLMDGRDDYLDGVE